MSDCFDTGVCMSLFIYNYSVIMKLNIKMRCFTCSNIKGGTAKREEWEPSLLELPKGTLYGKCLNLWLQQHLEEKMVEMLKKSHSQPLDPFEHLGLLKAGLYNWWLSQLNGAQPFYDWLLRHLKTLLVLSPAWDWQNGGDCQVPDSPLYMTESEQIFIGTNNITI